MGIGNAHAYLDPGTGSILLQGLLAAIAGSLVAVKLYWAKIKSFFSSKSETSVESDAAGETKDT